MDAIHEHTVGKWFEAWKHGFEVTKALFISIPFHQPLIDVKLCSNERILRNKCRGHLEEVTSRPSWLMPPTQPQPSWDAPMRVPGPRPCPVPLVQREFIQNLQDCRKKTNLHRLNPCDTNKCQMIPSSSSLSRPIVATKV